MAETKITVLLADDLPGVGPPDGNGHGGAGEARLVGPVGYDGLDTAAEVEGVLVRPGDFNFHSVGKFAFGRVQLPFAYKRVVRGP